MIKMLQYKMYPAGELAVLRQLLLFFDVIFVSEGNLLVPLLQFFFATVVSYMAFVLSFFFFLIAPVKAANQS